MVLPFQEHHIQTGCGSVSVIVYGDHDKPALMTYPDLALNCKCIIFVIIFSSTFSCRKCQHLDSDM
jgi:hypothetical protein